MIPFPHGTFGTYRYHQPHPHPTKSHTTLIILLSLETTFSPISCFLFLFTFHRPCFPPLLQPIRIIINILSYVILFLANEQFYEESTMYVTRQKFTCHTLSGTSDFSGLTRQENCLFLWGAKLSEKMVYPTTQAWKLMEIGVGSCNFGPLSLRLPSPQA